MFGLFPVHMQIVQFSLEMQMYVTVNHYVISLKQINRLRELDSDLAKLVEACVKVMLSNTNVE